MVPANSAVDPAITPATDITTNIGIHSRQSVVAAHARSERARQEFERRAQLLRECLCSEDFLANRGIGNEIGFHTFCYDPALEFEARALFDALSRDAEADKLPCTLKVVNLYDAVLAILKDLDVLEPMQEQEGDFGSEAVFDDVVDYCQPDAVSDLILDLTQPHEPGDVILLVGVGEVYPFLRVHNLFDSMQSDFHDVPVIAAYPGSFNGSSVTLFNRLAAENYYRAIDIS